MNLFFWFLFAALMAGIQEHHFVPIFMRQRNHPSRMPYKAISLASIGNHPNPKQNVLKWRIGAAIGMRQRREK